MEYQASPVPDEETIGIRRPGAVLVVDDDEDIRDVICEVLEPEGFVARCLTKRQLP